MAISVTKVIWFVYLINYYKTVGRLMSKRVSPYAKKNQKFVQTLKFICSKLQTVILAQSFGHPYFDF
jgi:hypothetical protein